MIGNNHSWDAESAPFWRSKCGKYTCATIGNPVNKKGFGLMPKHNGYEWDAAYDAISEKYGSDLHRFTSRTEAEKAFLTLITELIGQS